MIQLDPRPDEPDVMSKDKINAAREQCINNSIISEKFDFTNKNYWTKAKKELWEYQNHKCCFCERKRDPNAEADVEHFRPKGAVDEEPSHLGYQWLAYEWEHLFYSCKKCNYRPNKGTHFPIMGERAFKSGDDLSAERPFFIKPDEENPEDFIQYEWVLYRDKMVMPKGCDTEGRGEKTIKALGLDDCSLATERSKLLTDIRIFVELLIKVETSEAPGAYSKYQEILGTLKQKTDKKSEFAGFVRYFLKSYLGHDKYVRLFF